MINQNVFRNVETIVKSVKKQKIKLYVKDVNYSINYKTINAAGKIAKKGLLKTGIKPTKLQNVGNYYKKGASTIGTGLGSMPVLYPAKLTEALEQVDENFSPEDAFEYAVSSAVVEAAIETLNPDWKWSRLNVAKVRRAIKNSADPGQTILNYLTNARKIAFQNSLKAVPPELLEEFTQNYTNGLINENF